MDVGLQTLSPGSEKVPKTSQRRPVQAKEWRDVALAEMSPGSRSIICCLLLGLLSLNIRGTFSYRYIRYTLKGSKDNLTLTQTAAGPR